MRTQRITVFASGNGSNFKALHKATLSHDFPALITALVCDNAKAGALAYARSCEIRHYLIRRTEFPNSKSYVDRLENILGNEAPDLIVLAGYLKKIPSRIVKKYPRQIINIHPALLPKYGGKGYYGMRVHQAVIENGEKESGCTIHFVTNIYDDGPVIAQKKVPVYPDDTPESLAKKIQTVEHLLYPEVIYNLLKNQLPDWPQPTD
ncbi:MAG: phosphoribosylglycinamide formyltransferase [Balneolales bacterium]